MSLKDRAGDLADKAGDKIPDSVKEKAHDIAERAGDLGDKVVDKIPDSVKDMAHDLAEKAGELVDKAMEKLGIGDDDSDETDTPAEAATAATEPAADAAARTRRRPEGCRRPSARPVAPAGGPDVGAVRVERASRPAHRARRGAEAGDERLHRRAVDVGDRAASDDVRVGGDVGHVHHRAGGGVRRGQLGHRLRRRPRGAPGAHDRLELVAVLLRDRRTRRSADRRRRPARPSPVGRCCCCSSTPRSTLHPRSGRCPAGRCTAGRRRAAAAACPAARTPTAAVPSGGASSPAG